MPKLPVKTVPVNKAKDESQFSLPMKSESNISNIDLCDKSYQGLFDTVPNNSAVQKDSSSLQFTVSPIKKNNSLIATLDLSANTNNI